MSTTHHSHSAACCSIPPIIDDGYKAKGTYETINGIKTYVTGPPNATKAILYIFDIFGFFPQSLQGADILATSADSKDSKYLVFMPDWFDGKPADISWYPPITDEHKEKLGAFFGGIGAPPKTAERVPGYVKAAVEKYPSLDSWGAVGFCWGGKVISMTSGKGTLFKAAAECHPAMVSPDDAKAITIPLCMLASGDEDAEAVEAFKNNLTESKHVETFGDQIHGWMAARGDLKNAKVRAEYRRGYETLLEFFGRHL